VPDLPESKNRLISLDVFRGATLAAMILVNNAGDERHTYAPLKHASWHGWTFTDIIFPSFLWIVGVAMTLSFARRVEQGASRTKILLQTLRRCVLIYLLGLFCYGYPNFDFSTIRVLGVLQRIAICAFLGAIVYLYFRWKEQVVILLLLLGSYWAMMTLIPVPGYGAGDLSVQGNFEHYVDSLLLKRHLYEHTKTWDPEGIVSTMPSIATLIFGLLTGEFLRRREVLAEKAAWLFLAGNALLFAGAWLGLFMPINKKIWTSPFAIFMAGMSTVLFAICYWLVDAQGWRRFTKPFLVFGMNSIFVYILSEWISIQLSVMKLDKPLFEKIFLPVGDPYFASLLYAIANVLVCYMAAWVLYRKRWFIRL
jgi:predicted acyltransferase